MGTQQVVIIGAGCAGLQSAIALLKASSKHSVTLFDPHPPCIEDLPQSQQFNFHARQVIGINRDKHHVYSDDGKVHPYDKLILATGAQATPLHVEGQHRAGIYHLKNRLDIDLIKQQSPQTRHIVILGSAALGLDIAQQLQASRYQVTIIEPRSQLNPTHLDHHSAQCLAKNLETQGISILFNTDVQGIMGFEHLSHLVLSNGSQIICDLLINNQTKTVNTQLAESAGISFGHHICVRPNLKTTDAHIYALGDCIESSPHYSDLNSIKAQAQLIAKQLTSSAQAKAQPIPFELSLNERQLLSIGDIPNDIEPLQYFDANEQVSHTLYIKQHYIKALISYDTPEHIARFKRTIQQHKYIWQWQCERFIKAGKLWYR